MLEKIIEIAKMCCQEEIEYGRETSIIADMESVSYTHLIILRRKSISRGKPENGDGIGYGKDGSNY